MVSATQVVLALVLAVGAVLLAFELQPRTNLPDVVLDHPVEEFKGLLSPEQGTALRALINDMGKFPTNIQDVRFYTTKYEDIGEVSGGLGARPGCPCRGWGGVTGVGYYVGAVMDRARGSLTAMVLRRRCCVAGPAHRSQRDV